MRLTFIKNIKAISTSKFLLSMEESAFHRLSGCIRVASSSSRSHRRLFNGQGKPRDDRWAMYGVKIKTRNRISKYCTVF